MCAGPGADVHATDKKGETALHWASEYGKTELIELLLDNGAQINAKDHYVRTPMALALNYPREHYLDSNALNAYRKATRMLKKRGGTV